MKYVWVTPFHTKTSDIWDFFGRIPADITVPWKIVKIFAM